MLKRLFRLIARPRAERTEAPAPTDSLLLYIGTTTGHHYAPWGGKLYPSGLIGTDMRGYSAYAFDTIEIRSSFYHLPKPEMLANWAAQVPSQFRFALLASSRITHLHRLDGAEIALRYFLRGAKGLGDRCGPLLFQLPLGFAKDEACLARFLDLLPAHARAAFEFLDPSWHDEAIYDRLRERNCAVSVRDSEQSGASPFAATADWGYLRLSRMNYSDEELAGWVEHIQKTAWRTVYVYFRHDDDERAQDHLRRLEALTSS